MQPVVNRPVVKSDDETQKTITLTPLQKRVEECIAAKTLVVAKEVDQALTPVDNRSYSDFLSGIVIPKYKKYNDLADRTRKFVRVWMNVVYKQMLSHFDPSPFDGDNLPKKRRKLLKQRHELLKQECISLKRQYELRHRLLDKHTGDPECTRKLFAGHCAEHANGLVQELDKIKKGAVDEINADDYSKEDFRFPVES